MMILWLYLNIFIIDTGICKFYFWYDIEHLYIDWYKLLQ